MNGIKYIFLLFSSAWSLVALAQQKEFEGRIVYKNDIRSKVAGVDDKIWNTILSLGETTTSYVKQGNYKLITGLSEQYFILDKKQAFIKFRAIDTLYVMDYSFDTSTIVSISKEGGSKTISGYSCNPITIKTSTTEKKYFYAPVLYSNPEHDKDNTIGNLNILRRETSSVWLESIEEGASYRLIQTATQVAQENVNNAVFDLPALPQKKFAIENLSQPAAFKRAGGWPKYLGNTIDVALGGKYVRIPKGQNEATQTVMVKFMVNEKGAVVNAEVLNKDEVHAKLAAEALRVVQSSPLWTPATLYGEKTISWMQQGITFQASKN